MFMTDSEVEELREVTQYEYLSPPDDYDPLDHGHIPC